MRKTLTSISPLDPLPIPLFINIAYNLTPF